MKSVEQLLMSPTPSKEQYANQRPANGHHIEESEPLCSLPANLPELQRHWDKSSLEARIAFTSIPKVVLTKEVKGKYRNKCPCAECAFSKVAYFNDKAKTFDEFCSYLEKREEDKPVDKDEEICFARPYIFEHNLLLKENHFKIRKEVLKKADCFSNMIEQFEKTAFENEKCLSCKVQAEVEQMIFQKILKKIDESKRQEEAERLSKEAFEKLLNEITKKKSSKTKEKKKSSAPAANKKKPACSHQNPQQKRKPSDCQQSAAVQACEKDKKKKTKSKKPNSSNDKVPTNNTEEEVTQQMAMEEECPLCVNDDPINYTQEAYTQIEESPTEDWTVVTGKKKKTPVPEQADKPKDAIVVPQHKTQKENTLKEKKAASAAESQVCEQTNEKQNEKYHGQSIHPTHDFQKLLDAQEQQLISIILEANKKENSSAAKRRVLHMLQRVSSFANDLFSKSSDSDLELVNIHHTNAISTLPFAHEAQKTAFCGSDQKSTGPSYLAAAKRAVSPNNTNTNTNTNTNYNTNNSTQNASSDSSSLFSVTNCKHEHHSKEYPSTEEYLKRMHLFHLSLSSYFSQQSLEDIECKNTCFYPGCQKVCGVNTHFSELSEDDALNEETFDGNIAVDNAVHIHNESCNHSEALHFCGDHHEESSCEHPCDLSGCDDKCIFPSSVEHHNHICKSMLKCTTKCAVEGCDNICAEKYFHACESDELHFCVYHQNMFSLPSFLCHSDTEHDSDSDDEGNGDNEGDESNESNGNNCCREGDEVTSGESTEGTVNNGCNEGGSDESNTDKGGNISIEESNEHVINNAKLMNNDGEERPEVLTI